MSWTRLKNFAIIILVILNIVLTSLVVVSFARNNNYSRSSVESVLSLLKSSDIIVDKEIVPLKRVELDVYELTFNESEYMQVLKTFVGKNIFFEGESYGASVASGQYSIDKDFSFVYTAHDGYEPSQYKTEISDWTNQTKYFNMSKQFLNYSLVAKDAINSGSAKKISIHPNKLFRYNDGSYELEIDEYIGNYPTGNKVVINFVGDQIVKAAGRLTFIYPKTTYNAQNVDLINVLSNEKRYFDTMDHDVLTVSSIEYGYELRFDLYGNGFFFFFCSITYINDLVHVYDLITGKLVE
ncbi:MAG: hypothetical protein MJ236_04500 [Clostridia bacterium]|nr:hypothetical protein [Clostridia bacterium]